MNSPKIELGIVNNQNIVNSEKRIANHKINIKNFPINNKPKDKMALVNYLYKEDGEIKTGTLTLKVGD